MKYKNKNLLFIKSTLSEHGLSRTNFRTELLDLFYSSDNISLSVDDILKHFNNSIDKVTVYRSLKSFENKGLIHIVPDANNLKRYSLCRENTCNTISHDHNHGHFICYSCNQTFCLDEFKVPKPEFIKGFHIEQLKLTAEGYCQDCNKN